MKASQGERYLKSVCQRQKGEVRQERMVYKAKKRVLMQENSSLLHVTNETLHHLAAATITEWAVTIMRFPLFSTNPSLPLINSSSIER